MPEIHGSCEEHGCQWPQGLGQTIAERDHYRAALEVARSALLDVKATRKTDAWGSAVTEATAALTVVEAALGADR